MTTRRYDAYRRIRGTLIELSDAALADTERELLLDVAEGLLLARDEDQVEEHRAKGAVALSLLVGLGRWTDAAADGIWQRLIECGPGRIDAARHPKVLA